MTTMQLLTLPATAAAVTGVWLCLAWFVPLLTARRRAPANWSLVALGVPILGWLTLIWGPGIGVMGFALGLLTLGRRRLRPRALGRPQT